MTPHKNNTKPFKSYFFPESDDGIVFPSASTDKRRPVSRTKKLSGVQSDLERRRRPIPMKRNRNPRSTLSPMSSSGNLTERLTDRSQSSSVLSQISSTNTMDANEDRGQARAPIWCRSRSPKPSNSNLPSNLVDTGRTVEQVNCAVLLSSILLKRSLLSQFRVEIFSSN